MKSSTNLNITVDQSRVGALEARTQHISTLGSTTIIAGPINMSGSRITNLPSTPTAYTDAVSVNYIIAQGFAGQLNMDIALATKLDLNEAASTYLSQTNAASTYAAY